MREKSKSEWATLTWERIEAGDYASTDGRFTIIKAWDRLYGDHWRLHDNNVDDWYKSNTACDSLKHAKYVAELMVNRVPCKMHTRVTVLNA